MLAVKRKTRVKKTTQKCCNEMVVVGKREKRKNTNTQKKTIT